MKVLKAMVLAVAGMGLAAIAGCSSTAAPDAVSQAAAVTDAQGTATGLAEYRLDSGDQLKITVFNEDNLSGTFVVDGQGVISMSLIGEISAKNLTLRELQRLVETRLKDGFVRDPQVSAEVMNYRPYYILGEVQKPGEYPYTSGLTVMNAIASAGDFSYRADKRRVFIKSTDGSFEREVALTPSTVVRPGDTIRIRERLF
ncbi:MAG: polysaccharide biosynthesis/export family protein [Alphaproteobacteria bacterium]|nr:polysaccharide biosynthesis/export family protein [Alphaproteobacteria bacterium]